MRRHRALLPYLLVLPAVLAEIVVHIAPAALGLVLSFRRLDQFTVGDWTNAPGAGLANYRAGLNPNNAIGSEFYATLGRTALFTVLVVGLSWALGLFAAILLASPFRGRGFFRVYFLIPFALPAYATSIGWRFMLGRDNGAFNHLLVDDLHLWSHRPFWLIGNNAFWVLVLASVWRMWPFAYLMLAASLEVVPREQYDVALVSGAGTWRQVRSVTLPGIRPMNRVVLIVMVLWSFNEFTVPYVMFGGNPPASANLLSNVIYRDTFSTYNVGLAAAFGVAVAGIVVLAGLLPRLGAKLVSRRA